MIKLLKKHLKSSQRKVGEFDVTIIDEFNRKETPVGETNIEVRTNGLYPKTGDLMQVARYCFAGAGSIYTPARVIARVFMEPPKVYIDMADWKIPQIRELGEFYKDFKSPLGIEKEYKNIKEEESLMMKIEKDYEVILMNSEGRPLTKKLMSASGDSKPFALYNYLVGMSPFPETLDASSLFGEIKGLTRNHLIVQAVLHPLVGLPKVLVREGKGRTILDR